MSEPGAFVSVAEAAQQLGLSERQARRLSQRLAAMEGRTRTDARGHRLVTVADMAALRSGALREEGEPEQRPSAVTDGHERTDTDGQGRTANKGQNRPHDTPPDSAALDALREIITRQDAEIGYLREALQREQSIAMSATTDAQELRRRLLSLEALEKPTEGDSTAQGVSAPGEGGQTGQDETQVSQGGRSDSVSMSWWKRIFGGGTK